MKVMCTLKNIYPKMKHKVDRYVRYVNIVNAVLFTKNTSRLVPLALRSRDGPTSYGLGICKRYFSSSSAYIANTWSFP